MIIQGGGDGSNANISFVTKNDDLEEALKLSKIVASELGSYNVKDISNLAMISLVGPINNNKLDITNRILKILNEESVKPIMISGTDIKISVLIEELFFKKVLNKFHNEFIL